MPDYYGNPIPGVDTVYDYYGNIVAPTAAQAQAINAAYNQSQASGTPMVSQKEIGEVITPDVSAADYAAYVNASYQQAQITQPQGTGVTQLSNGIYVDAQGNQIGTGPTYITTPQGIATVPEAGSIVEQIAQNIALFGTAQPGTQTMQKLETLGKNESYLSAAGAFLSQQSAKKAAADTSAQSQNQGQAAQIALEIAKSGGTVDPYLAAKAAKQGYTVPSAQVGSTGLARSTVPTRDITSGMADAKYLSSQASNTIGFAYTPYGGQAQTELKDVKIGYSPTGEVGFYQQAPGRSTYNIVGGGSRAALQSGMFSIEEPLTPVVYTQESGGTKFAPSANIAEALKVLAEPSKYSRQGSEVYGGKVSLLTGATVESTGAQLSTYASPLNLASLVNPYDVNKGKAELPGADIPWGVGASTPSIFKFAGEGEAKPAKSAATTAPSAVSSPLTPSQSIELAIASGAVKSPFVSGTIQKPTGEVTVPILGATVAIPGLAFFQPSTFISGRASEVKEVPYSAMAGPDYTRQYVSPVTGKPVKEFTVAAGAPVVTERIIPETGETEITTTQTYITFPELPQTAKVYGFTAVEQKSEYEKVMDKEFRSRIPKPEEGEALLAVSQLVNPLSQEYAPLLAGKAIGYTAMEKLGLDTKPAKEMGELISSLTSPTKGQYTFFYEHPETAVVSYAAGGLFGAGTRGLGAIASKSGKLSAIAPYVSKYGGYALSGLYVGGATYEETGGFRTFTPETVAATKARLTQEGIPMTIGFGHGYALPENIPKAYKWATTYPQTKASGTPLDFMAREIGGKQPIREIDLTKLAGEPIRLARPDVAEGVLPQDIYAAPTVKPAAKTYSPFVPGATASRPTVVSGGRFTQAPKYATETTTARQITAQPVEEIDLRQVVDLTNMGYSGRDVYRMKLISERGPTKLKEMLGARKERLLQDIRTGQRAKQKVAAQSKSALEQAYTKVFQEQLPEKAMSQLSFQSAYAKVFEEQLPERAVAAIQTPTVVVFPEAAVRARGLAKTEAVSETSKVTPAYVEDSVKITKPSTISETVRKPRETPETTIKPRETAKPRETTKPRAIETPRITPTTRPTPTTTREPTVTPPRITRFTDITKTPPTVPPPATPIIPILPTLPTATSGGSGGSRIGARRFTEKFSVGEGVGYISLSGKQRQAPKPTRQPATTMRSMAPPKRPVGKTPTVRANIPTIKKKGRKR